jgi:hypothetical protein
MATGDVEIDEDFVAPSFQTEAPSEVTETQFIRACVRSGIITGAEGEAYLARGELPAMMSAVLNTLPEPQRTDARLKAVGSSSFSRNDDVFAAMVAAGVATDGALDDVFRLASTL